MYDWDLWTIMQQINYSNIEIDPTMNLIQGQPQPLNIDPDQVVNEDDNETRAIGKKLSIEEANVDDGWTTNITLPPNRRLRINHTGSK